MERAFTIACAAWITRVHRIESKAALAKMAWQRSLTAGALRQRVFELRYPERDLAVGKRDQIGAFEELLNSSGPVAFLGSVSELSARLRNYYETYLDGSDETADGPTFRILEHALADLVWSEDEALAGAEDEPTLVGYSRSFSIPDIPARDDRYHLCSFYWPDILDPTYPYGEGLQLRLRSAISHLNEVWAVEMAGAILFSFAESLGWEFIADAARWAYDESRHMFMGARRLDDWGFERSEIPLGSYIYEACAGRSPLIRLGMLAYFETKNIGKKKERAAELARLGDPTGHRDMDFDWADEAIHATYGRRWMKAALEAEGRPGDDWSEIIAECDKAVADRVARATDEERRDIRAVADALLKKAELTLTPS
jgi:uncharacterized ferritin-like protein (DUF455 family)